MKKSSTTPHVAERKMSWDSLNRLRAISDNGYVSLYWYDADGNRTVKEHLGGEAVWVNGTHAGTSTDTVSYTGSGYGDLGVSLTHNSFPVFTIGHDGKIHGIRGYRNNKGEVVGLEVSLSLKESSRYNLLSGVTSLYSIIQRLPKIVKR